MVKTCKVCGKPIQREITAGDWSVVLNVGCDCDKARFEAEEKEREEIRRSMKSSDIIYQGYLDKAYAEPEFSMSDDKDSDCYKDLLRYAEQWPKMKEENIGLMLFGDVGVGKTFYACSIANYVRKKFGDYVYIGSLPDIINRMNENFGANRFEIDRKIATYPLMVIDDLGIERNTTSQMEKMEQIIDLRSRAKLPLIVTTNITKEEITSTTDVDKKRIYSRLQYMCVPYVVKGTDRRTETGNKKAVALRNAIRREENQ